MTRILLLTLALTVAASPLRLATAADEHRKRAIDPIVVVIVGFDVSRDGSVHNIRVVRCENPSDRSEAKGALTPREQSAAVSVFTRGTLKAPSTEAGKTLYTYLLFDRRTRQFTKKT